MLAGRSKETFRRSIAVTITAVVQFGGNRATSARADDHQQDGRSNNALWPAIISGTEPQLERASCDFRYTTSGSGEQQHDSGSCELHADPTAATTELPSNAFGESIAIDFHSV